MKVWVSYFQHQYLFSHTEKNEIPIWNTLIERWYQLDSASFGLTDATYHWTKEKDLTKPEIIILASPGASIQSDLDFVLSGFESSQKFAHTLPNVRISPVLQLLKCSGMILCVQKDPCSISAGLIEAVSLLKPAKTAWLFSVQTNLHGGKVHCLEISDAHHKKGSIFSIEVDPSRDLNKPDLEVLNGLSGLAGGPLLKEDS